MQLDRMYGLNYWSFFTTIIMTDCVACVVRRIKCTFRDATVNRLSSGAVADATGQVSGRVSRARHFNRRLFTRADRINSRRSVPAVNFRRAERA